MISNRSWVGHRPSGGGHLARGPVHPDRLGGRSVGWIVRRLL